MLDRLLGGIAEFGHGYGHNNYRRGGGYGFEEHKEFVTHVESDGGYFDRQARYDRMRLPTNHGRPPMTHMPVCDEEDSDVEEYFESSQSHHTTTLPHHSNNLHHQPPHVSYRPPPPGKMSNGWHGQHEDAYHGGHHGGQGMQHHGGHGMQHHGEHGMQHHGEHGMQHHGGNGMQHYGGGQGMKHQGGHGMQHYGGGQGMKHQDRLMAPQVPPRHVYMSPNYGSGDGRAVVVKATENWRVSNSSRKTGWGSKGL